MTAISASLVKELRDQTGAGMMDCKRALEESSGDVEAAKKLLREKGIAAAGKRGGRETTEGKIVHRLGDSVASMVAVGCETEPVSNNEEFIVFAQRVVDAVESHGPEATASLEDERIELVAKLGENVVVLDAVRYEADEGEILSAYAHPPAFKLGALLHARGNGDLAYQLAMHIAAAAPAAITVEELDPALIERERAVYTEQARASGKPPEIAAKMVEGRLRKEFFQQVVLMQQTFLGAGGDGKATVAQVLKDAEKTAGAPIKIAKFARYALGEGIDKKDGDFAAEVAKAAGKQ